MALQDGKDALRLFNSVKLGGMGTPCEQVVWVMMPWFWRLEQSGLRIPLIMSVKWEGACLLGQLEWDSSMIAC